MPGVAIVNERNSFVEKKWVAETQEFKDALVSEIEGNYKEALAEYKRRGEWDGTALSYYEVWNKSRNLLPGITDAIGKLFGGGVVMFVFGPSAVDGDIVVRSCTGIIPNTKLNKTDLYDFDPQGFKAASSMCVRYGQAVFSSDFCKSRIVSKDDIQRVAAEADDNITNDETRVYESRLDVASPVPIGSCSDLACPERQSLDSESRPNVAPIPVGSSSVLAHPENQGLDSLASPLLHLSQAATGASSSTSPASTYPPTGTHPIVSTLPSPHPSTLSPSSLSVPDVSSDPIGAVQGNMIQTVQSPVDLYANSSPDKIRSWLASANVDNMFDNATMTSVENSLLNASPEDLEKLTRNPYYTHGVAWQNEMLDSGIKLFTSAEDTPPMAPGGIQSALQQGHSNDITPLVDFHASSGATFEPRLPQQGDQSSSILGNVGYLVPTRSGPGDPAQRQSIAGSSSPCPATDTVNVLPPALSDTVTPPMPPQTSKVDVPPPASLLTLPQPSPSNPTVTSAALSLITSTTPLSPHPALTPLPEQVNDVIEKPIASGEENERGSKHPNLPTLEQLDQPPVKRRKKAVNAAVGLLPSELIAARKPSRNIVKPARFGEPELVSTVQASDNLGKDRGAKKKGGVMVSLSSAEKVGGKKTVVKETENGKSKGKGTRGGKGDRAKKTK
ncbi:hypothetical protein E1B28_013062 [Marasmius oreades]|uniref:Uncharacterized protein n=1 Tax=Marasmius oreades TaxID=181124 RepID=A0A9P7UMK9_9AGAR|nr:uncharacterized protein E1B28_013062 [Marasmius oreades]KAG7087080.1 hypothetical protein E1B28_013062 [Marasmius oreades]